MSNNYHTLILAHRGANRVAPENTRAAFDFAQQMQVDGIETDIQLSQDQVAVLWHDRTLAKLGRDDLRIDDLSFAQLITLSETFSCPIMRLDDFWQNYHTNLYLLLEVKNRLWEPVARHQQKMQIAMTCARSKQYQQVSVSSFNLDSLIRAYQSDPSAPLVYNIEPEQQPCEVLALSDQHAFLSGICLPVALLTDELVNALKQRGKQIAVYTCNSEQEISLALALQVDILISDVPDYALSLRGK